MNTLAILKISLLLLLLVPLSTLGSTRASSDQQQQGFPFTIPSQQQQQLNQKPPTVEDLIKKYGVGQPGISLPSSLFKEVGKKAIILTFDDNWKAQYTYAEPILRKNGFNATFFIQCLGIEQGPGYMTADMVRDLHAKRYDIESHSMTHPDLEHVDDRRLDYEIGTAKECIQDMVPGLNITIYAPPYSTGRDNTTVLQRIKDAGYEFSRVGYGGSFDIQCNGWYVPENQTAGCEMYEPGTKDLKFQSRWNIPVLDIDGIGREYNYSLQATQEAFVKLLDDAIGYDDEGKLDSLPLLVYHNFTNRVLSPDRMGQSLLAESFAQEMQYLRDNNYTVLSMRDLVYDPMTATFSIPKLEK